MKFWRCLIGLFFIAFFSATSQGQSENTLYWLESVYQSSATNPVSVPNTKVSIGLPVLSGGSTYGYLQHHTVENSTVKSGDSLIFDEDLLLKPTLSDKNYIGVGARVSLFHLQVKIHKTWWSFHVNDRLNYRIRYPKELIMLGAEGNAQFEGQLVDLSNFAVDASYYREFALGFVTEREKWNFGGKAKLLFGMANIDTQFDRFDYEIKDEFNSGDPGYKQIGYIDGTLRTSGVDTTGNKSFEDYLVNTSNVGAALDFGATFKMNDKWTFGASVLDFGFIRWGAKDNINYNFDGDTSIVGFDPASQFFEDENENFGNVFDSIETAYNYSTDNNAYTTMLNYKVNLSAQYHITESTDLSALLQFNNYYGFRPSLNIGVGQKIKRVFHIVVTNTFEFDDAINIGIGGVLKLGPVQIFAVTDHIDGVFDAYSTSNVSARFGMNFVFGRVLPQESLPYNFY